MLHEHQSSQWCVPKGIRTPVTAVKGRCPRPLDDGDRNAEKNKPSVLTVGGGGARRDRTADLLHAMQALSQLSYGPITSRKCDFKRLADSCQPLRSNFPFIDILAALKDGDSYGAQAASARVASAGSCFIERSDSTGSPQAKTRCPRARILIAPTTSAFSSKPQSTHSN